ncbi:MULTISPECIES: MerR family transcriptional regulator [unclassified Ornithinimicrobium]|uniref:MerR family transcriptional regulator n=1 Tax=unclassified Ornithinimicrobium TaxID=2615080 RepID=UPI003853AD60
MHYTVKQVSALTGIAPDRLRAWERRYGVVSPQRSESRYRLYDDDDLARLRLMLRLVEAGTPASLAAERVLSSSVAGADWEGADGVASGGAASGAAVPEPSTDEAPAWPRVDRPPFEPGLPAVDALVAPAQSLDRAQVDGVLDRAFAAGPFETVVEDWLVPALGALGMAWVDGRIDISGEHFVSAAVHRRLTRAFETASVSAKDGPVVLVGLPPAALHELGAFAFATCLRRLGIDVRWLGRDLPVDSWAHARATLRPDAVVVSVPTAMNSELAAAVVQRLHEEEAGLLVFVGGRGADGVNAGNGVTAGNGGAAIALPDSLVQSAHEVAVAVRSGH